MGRETTEGTVSRVGETVFDNYNRNPEGDASRAADIMMRELNKVEARNPSVVNEIETAVLTDPNLKPILPAIELAYQKNRNGYSGDDGQFRVSSSAVLADLNSDEPMVRQSARAYQRAFALERPSQNGARNQDITGSQVEAKIRDLSDGEVNEKIKEYKRAARKTIEEQSVSTIAERLFKQTVSNGKTDLFGFIAARTGGSNAIEKRDLDAYIRDADKYNQWKKGSSHYKRTHECPVKGEDQIFFGAENQKAVKTLLRLWKSDTVEDLASEIKGRKAIERTDLYDFTARHGKKAIDRDETRNKQPAKDDTSDFRPVYNRENNYPRPRLAPPYDYRSRRDQNYPDYSNDRNSYQQRDLVTVRAVSATDYDYYRQPHLRSAEWAGNDRWSGNDGTFGTNCFPWLNQSNSWDRPYYSGQNSQSYRPAYSREPEQNQNRGFLGFRIGGFSLGIGL